MFYLVKLDLFIRLKEKRPTERFLLALAEGLTTYFKFYSFDPKKNRPTDGRGASEALIVRFPWPFISLDSDRAFSNSLPFLSKKIW